MSDEQPDTVEVAEEHAEQAVIEEAKEEVVEQAIEEMPPAYPVVSLAASAEEGRQEFIHRYPNRNTLLERHAHCGSDSLVVKSLSEDPELVAQVGEVLTPNHVRDIVKWAVRFGLRLGANALGSDAAAL